MFKAGDDSGLTLLETLVVVAVTALVAAIAFPRVDRTLTTISLHGEAQALTANLKLARAQAISRAAPVTFSIARDARGYGWTGSVARRVPDALQLSPADASIVFYPDGSATGGTVNIAAGKRAVPIRVDAVTGSVAMVRP